MCLITKCLETLSSTKEKVSAFNDQLLRNFIVLWKKWVRLMSKFLETLSANEKKWVCLLTKCLETSSSTKEKVSAFNEQLLRNFIVLWKKLVRSMSEFLESWSTHFMNAFIDSKC